MAAKGQFPSKIVAPNGDRAEINPAALTAAGVRLAEERNDGRRFRRIQQPWQQTVFTYYHTVPECWYAAQYYARSLSMIRVFAARKDDSGEIKELPASDPASKLLARIQDPSGGTAQLFSSYGRLRFLVGEGFLVCSDDYGTERWEFLSSRELRVYDDTNKYIRVRAPGLDPEDLEDLGDDDLLKDGMSEELEPGQITPLPATGAPTKAVVWRLWRRDPEFSSWADAPTRAVLDLFEELLLLQLAVRARAKSRLANAGILLLAQELDFGPIGAKIPGEDQKQDPFMAVLQDAMVTPIKDPGTAKAVVPIVGRIPAELIDRAYALIKIHDPKETYPEEGLRKECIWRIATGLDMPQEVLLGMSDVNHWGSWQIDESSFKQHIRPVCQELVDDLTSVYLRPAAKLDGIEDWQSLVVGYDPAELVNHPDKSKDAKELRALGALSLESVREATGFRDSDKLDLESDDGKIWLATQFGDPQMLPEAMRPEIQEPVTTSDDAPDGDPQDKEEPERPEDEDADQDEQQVQENEKENVAAAAVVAAAALTGLRARELAGSRLRSKVNGEYKQVENVDLVVAVGAERVHNLGLTASGLVAGAGELFRRSLVDDHGLEEAAALKLAELVESYSARNLFDPLAALPDQFAGFVRRVV